MVWQYHEIQYDKDEYIRLMSEKNDELDEIKHPYHLISQDGGGVYGWVDGADIAAIGSPMPIPPQPPEKPVGDKSDPSAVQQTAIKVGGKVNVLKAQTYTGGSKLIIPFTMYFR